MVKVPATLSQYTPPYNVKPVKSEARSYLQDATDASLYAIFASLAHVRATPVFRYVCPPSSS